MVLSPWPTTKAKIAEAVSWIKSVCPDERRLRVERVGAVSAELVERYLAGSECPQTIKNEAVIRCAGWLLDRPSDGRTSEVADVGPIKVDRSYQVGQLSALRHSGSLALLSPFKIRRAGVI